jgi:DNA adenine methylase
MGPIPHLLPYQGSKRQLAERILDAVAGRHFERLIEPFAGSAAVTLAAAAHGLADHFHMGDSLLPLARLWQLALDAPGQLSAAYAALWRAQHQDPRAHYLAVRERFNRDADPASLLYLLARCVKSAPRFNAEGAFNQAADHRRRGVHPDRLERRLKAVSALLAGRCQVHGGDFRELLAQARPGDLVYLDPPWAGTTTGRDKRYHSGLATEELIAALRELNRRQVPFLLSYDGRSGQRSYGAPLPEGLGLQRLEIAAGRSSQATLLGRTSETVESLYLCPRLRSC